MFKRIARLFKSILNSILGRAEAELTIPQMELAYREMQQKLFKYKQAVAGAIAYEKRAQRKLEQEKARVEAWMAKARAAAQRARATSDLEKRAEAEKLARRALQLKIEAESNLALLQDAYDKAHQQAERARKQFNLAAEEVEKRARQLQQAKTLAELNKSRQEVASLSSNLDIDSAAGVFDEGLERVLSEGDRFDAMEELVVSEGDELDQKLAALTSASKVDQDFDALMAELSGANPERSPEAGDIDLDTALS